MTAELKIALIQSDLYWENIEANLSMLEEKIWQIGDAVDLIVLPEMFTTGFSMNASALAEPVNSKTFRWMKQQAAQTRAVVMGSYMVQVSAKFFNRLYAVYPDGSSQYYDKKHRFGLAGEDRNYTAGNHRLILTVKGWRILPLICYDLRFPVWARSRKSKDRLYEYDLLVYVANWPEPRVQAWDTLLAARAIENTAYCAGVNRTGTDGGKTHYTGHSAVYDYLGQAKVFSDQQEILTATLSHEQLLNFRTRFPFQADADDFEWRK